jgi:hypothetical protein
MFYLNTERMKFLEKDLEQIIWESSNEKLQEKGLLIMGKKLRQLKIGNYGIADLVTIERIQHDFLKGSYLYITVFELKKEKAGISAFLQALRYCKGISSYLNKKKPSLRYKLNIVLCSKEIDTTSDYIFLTDLIESESFGVLNSVKNYSFNYSIDGIEFKMQYNYGLTNEGF